MLERPMLSFATGDGVSLRFQVDDFTNPWEQSETLILIHAAMGSSRRMHLWVPHLARDVRVVRPDMRGHGQSMIGPDDTLDLERLTLDVVELMDHLGIDSAHLAGSSAGGAVAMNTAITFPDRVKSLGAFATLPGLKVSAGHTQYGSWVDRIGSDGIAGFLRKTIADRFDVEAVDPDFIDWFIAESARNDPESLRRFVPMMAAVDISGRLGDIHCPTLCVVPGSDPIHTPEQYALLKDGIADCRFVTYDAKGHNITDAFPDRCAQDLVSFLRDIRR
ncbi:MAG: alpha/beta hydrolase [Salinarimonadaceae bacterium]|nr:MAG: alpha/beta hydrolase [Salinarimonadaceae bacterium]